jgi:hypothetical protein
MVLLQVAIRGVFVLTREESVNNITVSQQQCMGDFVLSLHRAGCTAAVLLQHHGTYDVGLREAGFCP